MLNRLIPVLLALVAPLPVWALSIADMRHLLDRTGFGARPESIEIFASLDREAAVEHVLAVKAMSPQPPDWAQTRPFPDRRPLADLPEAERLAAIRAQNRLRAQRGRALKEWWATWLLVTESPLVERMTLFWHNHFTSQLRVVRSPQLMLRQHQLLRHHALGNYSDLLRAVVTDPAMLIYLDGRKNNKARPNENFARELLELFTLGEGYYSEADIQAAARALTGWRLDRASGVARFNPRQFDDGEKTFLKQTGHWGPEALVAIVLAQPRAAEWIVEKLWIELISPEPDTSEVTRLAGIFRDSGYEIRPLLLAMLTSDAFWAQPNRGALIKSPVELVVGTLRRFDLPDPPPRQLVALTQGMGQDLLDPPDVKGWPGQDAWINADRLLARDRFLRSRVHDLADESAKPSGAWAELDTATVAQLLRPVTDVSIAPTVPRTQAGEQPGKPSTGDSGVRVELIQGTLDLRYQLK